jgi:recombination associated protein RdgC
LKKIELLDGVLDGADIDATHTGQEDDSFDADVAIMTGELRRLLTALTEVLGGMHEHQATAPTPSQTTGAQVPWDAVPA